MITCSTIGTDFCEAWTWSPADGDASFAAFGFFTVLAFGAVGWGIGFLVRVIRRMGDGGGWAS